MGLQQQRLSYDQSHFADHYYLCNYRPKSSGADRLSSSLLRFKNALPQDIYAWIDCALHELEMLAMPANSLVIRVLHSNETGVRKESNTALDQLGRAVAKKLGIHWMPELICKSRVTRKVKYLSLKERRAELKNVYALSSEYFDFDKRTVLLIDDILTTGTTVISIIRLIREYFPGSAFKVFTLARSAYDPLYNSRVQLSGEHYLWHQQSWVAAEGEPGYGSYEKIKECILNDRF